MNVKELLINLINSKYNYPVFLQGSLSEDQPYPESFFTFWNNDNPEESFYDNEPNRCIWHFWLYFYSNDPKLVFEIPLEVKKLLKENNFIVDGKPTDLKSDEPTHTGAVLDVYYIENYND